MYHKFIFAAIFLLGVVSLSEGQLVFRKGWETTYAVRASLDAKGMSAENGKRTAGTTSALNANMIIRCDAVMGDTAAFTMIVMNAQVGDGTSNSDVVVSSPILDSFVDKKKIDKHLGEPTAFTQRSTGEILSVSFHRKDKEYYKNVKLGLINSLHTKIVPAGTSQTIQDRDVVGVHTSKVTGSNAVYAVMEGDQLVQLSTLNVQKTFDQTGFSQFVDPTLKPNNVKLQADTTTQLNTAGFVQSAVVNQVVAMVNIGAGAASLAAFEKLDMLKMLEESKKRQSAQDEPGDLFLSSFGSMTITAGARVFMETPSIQKLAVDYQSEEYETGDLFDTAFSLHKLLLESQVPEIDIQQTVQSIFEGKDQALNTENGAKTIRLMDLAIQYFNVRTESLSLLLPYLQSIQDPSNQYSEAVAGLSFYILSGINKEKSVQLFVEFGIESKNFAVQKAALLASHTSTIDNELFLESIAGVYENTESKLMKSFALLALGSVSSRSSNPKMAKEILHREAMESLQIGEDEERTIDAILAVGNAGKNVFVDVDEVFQMKFQNHPSKKVANKLIQVLQNSFDLDFAADPDYPFSKSKDISFKLGGKTVGAEFSANAFVGTNFNCNQTTFNYKAAGNAGIYVLLFGKRKEAVGVDAEYGQNGGSLLSNAAHLTVWGKVIKTMNFPGLGECITKTYPLAHAAPGFSVRYTIFVSVVPITFSAGASLKLNLEWGWQLCPRDLYAEVSISPHASLVFSGDAKIDLLIIKAGTGIDGSLGASIVPKGYVRGTQCLIGLGVDMVGEPLSIKMASYVQWKKCKLLIFDCKWGTRKEFVWFNWSRPSQTKNLWKQEFKIVKGG